VSHAAVERRGPFGGFQRVVAEQIEFPTVLGKGFYVVQVMPKPAAAGK